jgi:hypothetical protein
LAVGVKKGFSKGCGVYASEVVDLELPCKGPVVEKVVFYYVLNRWALQMQLAIFLSRFAFQSGSYIEQKVGGVHRE